MAKKPETSNGRTPSLHKSKEDMHNDSGKNIYIFIRNTMQHGLCLQAMAAILLLAACSTTSNIPEDEQLYAGIKRVDYDKAPQTKENKENGSGDGVILAIADAYHSVEELLIGLPKSTKEEKKRVQQLKDSIDKVRRQDKLAYNTAKEEVEAVLAFAPNGAIMGSSYTRWPWSWRMGIYNRYMNSTSRFGKWMFNTFAATPKYISTANPNVRTQIARNTLRNHGFFRGKAEYEIMPEKKPRQAKIAYSIQSGPLYHLDTIRYQMFAHKEDSILSANERRRLLKQGEPFNVANLDAERNRISNLFRNNGFYYHQPQHVAFRADTLQRPLNVQLQVRPQPNIPERAKRQYYIGKTLVSIKRNKEYTTTDTLGRRDVQMAYYGDGKPPLKMSAVRRFLFYRRGDLYRHNLHSTIQEILSEMGIFSSLRMNYIPRDTSATNDTLDVFINATLDKPYDAAFEGKITTKSNGQVGPGVSFSMAKNNAFRGAEKLGLKLWGSYEWQTGANRHGNNQLINSYEYGASLNLTYPRFMFLGMGRRLNRKTFSTTDFQIESKWLNRANYFGRVSLGTRVAYTFLKNKYEKHELTPFRLDYEVQLNTTPLFDSIMNANQALSVSMRNQFVPSMEYTYNWKSHRYAPRTFMLNIKEAGNVTSGIYAAFGEKFKKQDKELFGVPFAQYLKTSLQYTHLFRLTSRSGIATRVFGGIIYSYGNSTIAPYNDLFTIGGANSIRAFSIRSIGPGSYHPANSMYSYIDQMGEIKLEANVEYRFPIIADLFGAVFIDAGNVWLRNSDPDLPGGEFNIKKFGKELALGTGAGLRYDLDFLVIRFDVGVGIHAPYETGKSGYYNMPKFGKSLGYHLAIGYPF